MYLTTILEYTKQIFLCVYMYTCMYVCVCSLVYKLVCIHTCKHSCVDWRSTLGSFALSISTLLFETVTH